ncbi:enoyl-CoA hydratase/isomerase family protein [Pigmentiphaga aceris]|uniref:Enoyl-CoA hydratase/isomerase family protein n=1 Tax=Pigmentiphaga aceris TaxID=1940612 RepID=A0A5C0AY13_9BURK|nr:enoyl-CoA hydratase/isomerase family protein [Pigmentiphaga aceris]QEI06626.1 enoyl-CoA hydratase/isomerase family protein [Pigmentiphaga aceris]
MVTIERHGMIAVVRYVRGAKANALSLAAANALLNAARELADDKTLRAVVLAGSPKVFSAGIDLSDSGWWGADDPLATQQALARGELMCRAWAELPMLTIAAIEGAAVGGGAVLANCCDLRVMGDGAFVAFPEVRLGVPLAWGGLPRLVALLGPARAKRLLFSDLRLDGASAMEWGLADALAPAGQAVDVALGLAREASECPPISLRLTKRAIDAQAYPTAPAHAQGDQFLLCHLLAQRAKIVGAVEAG